MRRCVSMLVVLFMFLVGPVLVFSNQSTAQEAVPTSSSSVGEPGPVFASDQWRIAIVAGVRSAGINAVGLPSGTGQDWLLVVADVTNWGSEDATLNVNEFDVRSIDEIDGVVGGIGTDGAEARNTAVTATALNLRAGPSTEADILDVIPEGAAVTLLGGSENGFLQVSYDGLEGWAFAEALVLDGDVSEVGQSDQSGTSFFVPQSTSEVASQLGTEPTNVEAGVLIGVDETKRVSFVFQVPADFEGPALFRKTALPLDDVLASEPNLNDLPEIVPAPSLEEGLVDDVTDGRTIRLFLPADNSNLTLKLLGVDAPIGDECFAQEAAARLRQLAGDTVWLESDMHGDDMVRYVWVDQNGTKLLVNQALIAEGYVAVADMGQNTRFTTWLAEAERTAAANSLGLWGVCTGPHGTLLTTPTPLPPTPTPTPAQPSEAPLSAAEIVYAAQIVEQTETLSESFERFSWLMLAPDLFNLDWQLSVVLELALWKAVYQEAQAMTPPPRFAAIHGTYVEALSYFDSAADDIAEGIDNLDPSLLNRALTKLEQGIQLLETATVMVDELASNLEG